MAETTLQTTHYDKDRGRVDCGCMTNARVDFHTPFPNRPSVHVNGLYGISVDLCGFSLDRVPDQPLHWVAQEVPAFVFEASDISRIINGDH